MKTERNRNSGLGLLSVLQVIFIVLKFTNLIDWSWPIVLIPIWISLSITALVLIIFLVHLLLISK